ncbi:MAG: permease [Thermoplasmata archaeon]|nr:permease [Thermoplasmata archaeon]
MKLDIGMIYLILALILLIVSTLKNPQKTKKALKVTGKIALTVFPVLFLIFILMGIIEAFVSKEVIATWLGSGSGALSVLIGEIVGCFALVQPAAVFPFAGYLHDSGADYGAVSGFVMTAILIGISTLPLELKLFGIRFTVVRNILTFVCVFFMGILFMVIL